MKNLNHLSSAALRLVLVLTGLFIVFTAIDGSFGGINTLGWQGSNQFLEVTNPFDYAIRDSHVRFVGGIWLAVGLLFLIATTNLRKYEAALKFAFIAIFLGGLIRFSQMDLSVIFSTDIIGSLIAELIGMSILFVWLTTTVKTRLQKA